MIFTAVMLPEYSFGKNKSILNFAGNAKPVCTDWAKILLGEYEISNNIWGKGNIHDYSQCIFGVMNPRSGLPENMGWTWSWPASVVGVKAYPSILYGRKPWNDFSTTSHLPQTINQLKRLTVSFKLKTEDRGAVNLLLESWITKIFMASPEDRVGELAIQFYQKNWPGQAGKYIESIEIDGISFDFYIDKKMRVPGDTHTWAYYGFVHKGTPVLQAKIDVMQFISYLVRHGYVEQNHYIATVELGNEIDHGAGKTLIEHFSVQVGQ